MSIDPGFIDWWQSPTGLPWWELSACVAVAFGAGTIWTALGQKRSIEPDQLADENHQLRSQLRLREWELDLTRRFLGTRELSGRLRVLLDSLIADPQQGFAAILRIVGPRMQLEEAVGLLPDSRRKLTLNSRVVQDTIARGSLSLTSTELTQLRAVEGLATLERSRLSNLYCFRLGGNRDPWGVLISSELPAFQPGETASLSGWEHLTSILGEELASQESTDKQGNELALTKEMLELRSLPDQQFRSPTHMLQEYLRRLAEMTDFDRAALVLHEDEQPKSDSVQPLRGGGPLSRELMEGWELAESQLFAEAAGTSSSAIWSVTELKRLGVAGPISFAVMLPLRQHDWVMGHLCLTRRTMGSIPESDRKLIDWGVKFLVELIARTVDRAAIELQARRDGLTHLANRHTFDIELDRTFDRAIRVGDALSLILLDLDHFKSVNDTHGHLGGDAALKTVARVVERSVQSMREGDQPLVARYGGEELAVLLPGVGEAGSRRIAEAIREAVWRTPIPFEGAEFHLTLSAGVATRSALIGTTRGLISAADAALYRAKMNGRNCVEVAGSGEEMTQLPAAPR